MPEAPRKLGKAQRGRRGPQDRRQVHVLATWPDGAITGAALCGATPSSGWTVDPAGASGPTCARCVALVEHEPAPPG